ncbi:MAG: hypothetical protein GX238_00510 [Epulopiscium sp.]|nr:hypothetical protein [Candidatus Epulonipiscium sp.]
MYYTVMPPIVQREEIENTTVPQGKMCIYKNQTIEVVPEGEKFKIQRIFSTDLKAYLEVDLQPGSFIDLSLMEEL